MQDKLIIKLLSYYKSGHLTEKELIEKLEQLVITNNLDGDSTTQTA